MVTAVHHHATKHRSSLLLEVCLIHMVDCSLRTFPYPGVQLPQHGHKAIEREKKSDFLAICCFKLSTIISLLVNLGES